MVRNIGKIYLDQTLVGRTLVYLPESLRRVNLYR